MLTLLTGKFKHLLTESQVLRHETGIIDFVRGLTEGERADLVSAYRALGDALEKGDAPIARIRYPGQVSGPDGFDFFPSEKGPVVVEDEAQTLMRDINGD